MVREKSSILLFVNRSSSESNLPHLSFFRPTLVVFSNRIGNQFDDLILLSFPGILSSDLGRIQTKKLHIRKKSFVLFVWPQTFEFRHESPQF